MQPPREPGFQALIGRDPPTRLVAERLRDGRIAMGTQVQKADGRWEPGELHFLEPSVYLDLAAWLSPAVEAVWVETVWQRQAETLRTAHELYGEGPGALTRLAAETMREIPPPLLVRGLILLANAVGPQARERLVELLNETDDRLDDQELRRRLADQNEGFAYAIAAAGLFDALVRGIYPEKPA